MIESGRNGATRPLDLTRARVLVTGAAGFIGSAVVWALNRRGHAPALVTDYLGQGEHWRNLVPLAFQEYCEADELLQRIAAKAIAPFDLIVHLGGCSSTTERNGRHLIESNYGYTRTLAEWAVAQGTRFVYASSAATYGGTAADVRDDDDPDVISRLRPLNMYGYSKHLFDLYASRTGLARRIAGLKYFNVYGPNEAHKGDMRSLVHKAYTQVCETGRVGLFKSYRAGYRDGEQCRDFLYVKDAADMTLALATNTSATGLFNVGSGESHTWIELAQAVFAALGREPVIDFIDMPDAIRFNYQYETRADIAKLRATGYTAPVTPLRDAVNDYVTNYLVPGRMLGDEAQVR
jgi:ADP-L-glycero-D-manno-heptose 6-epimerase